MHDKDLAQIEKEILQGMDHDSSLLAEIENTAEEAAATLSRKQKCLFCFKDKTYCATAVRTFAQSGPALTLIIYNVLHIKIYGQRYKPFFATVAIDNAYTHRQILQTAVRGFLLHVSGHALAQEI